MRVGQQRAVIGSRAIAGSGNSQAKLSGDLAAVRIRIQQQVGRIRGQRDRDVADAAADVKPGMRLAAGCAVTGNQIRGRGKVKDALLTYYDVAVRGLHASAGVDQGVGNADIDIAHVAREVEHTDEAIDGYIPGSGAGADGVGSRRVKRVKAGRQGNSETHFTAIAAAKRAPVRRRYGRGDQQTIAGCASRVRPLGKRLYGDLDLVELAVRAAAIAGLNLLDAAQSSPARVLVNIHRNVACLILNNQLTRIPQIERLLTCLRIGRGAEAEILPQRRATQRENDQDGRNDRQGEQTACAADEKGPQSASAPPVFAPVTAARSAPASLDLLVLFVFVILLVLII